MLPGLTVSSRTALALALAIPLVMLAAACSKAPATAPVSARTVYFKASDGVQLEGKLYGKKVGVGVVLSHQFNSDQSGWFAFAQQLASEGFAVLTYDFRGYCPGGDAGCSRGKKDIANEWKDVVGASDFMRKQGVSRLFLIGASMGGTASLDAVGGGRLSVEGVITLSAPDSFEGAVITQPELAALHGPKLFIAGRDDPGGAAGAANYFYDNVGRPKQIAIYPVADHGTELLSGASGTQATAAVMKFLDTYSKVA